MKILIVDDSLERIKTFQQGNTNHNVYTATTVVDALTLLSLTKFDIILLDHDMSDISYTNQSGVGEGQAIVNTIIKKQLNKEANYIIHSLNPVGREMMYTKLKDSGFKVEKSPFAWLIKFI
jgi:CheY-like chemotaxis protein